MIRVYDVITRAGSSASGCTRPNGRRRIDLPTCHVTRSIDFYVLAFGFGLLDGKVPEAGQPVVLKMVAGAELVLCPQGKPTAGKPGLRGLLVSDLDAARQSAWDLGIRVAHDDGAPDQIYRRWNGRSLFIHDPDGNELELVEAARVSPPSTLQATSAIA